VSKNAPVADSSYDGERILALGEFEGGAPAIEDANGVVDLEARNIKGLEIEEILKEVEAFRDNKPMNQPPATAAENGNKSWKPWFPVIDYDRCTNCMQCLSFCLFDVYSVDVNNQIEVLNQDNCKTNCPACSRVCPEVAIMFPKYSAGPINGEPVSEGDVKREKMKVDISSLLGGDIYARLRDRSVKAKSRFSRERSSDKALNERVKCLKKLKSDGMIPQEVLDELDLSLLPSAEEIQRKAKAAAAKAQAALDARK
jgi:Pyruvate/2-oxoacid:ferredoxin oxidoreductase delta subunit